MIQKITLLGLGLSAIFFAAAGQQQPASKNEPSPITLRLRPVANGLQAPTAMAFPGNGDIWVAEQSGKIRLIRNGKLTDLQILDLSSKLPKMNPGYEERGLLGITLHPKFSSNRKFFVFYSTPSETGANHKDVVAEYTLPANEGSVDIESGRIILAAEKPDGNHNGGCIQFGKDGMLYISFGDGGGQGDKHGQFGNGQNLNTWLGKILRVDVNTDSGYLVPKDNPFIGRADARPEIWAYGFRNPYRFSFDRTSGQLFAGDVGQDTWEEIDLVTKGANYGWRTMEGSHCYNPATGCEIHGVTLPIAEYNHREGVSVMGGYVYNGKQLPFLKGKYLFADWTGPVFYLTRKAEKWGRGKVTLQGFSKDAKITGFSEDNAGEIYVMINPDTGPENTKGSVFKLVRN